MHMHVGVVSNSSERLHCLSGRRYIDARASPNPGECMQLNKQGVGGEREFD